MLKRWIVLTLLICSGVMNLKGVVPAEYKIRLTEGWEFIRQDMGSIWEVVRAGATGKKEEVPIWTQVALPHCFNAEDAVDPDVNYYQGPGWYRTMLNLNNPYSQGRILLEFEGAGQKTDVYIYTTRVGSHVGGYDGWTLDITEAVKAFQQSEVARKRFKGKIPLAVRCDNGRDTEMIPSDLSDFNLYGGLYRYVNLIYVPSLSFERIRIDAKTDVKGKHASLKITPSFYMPEPVRQAGQLEVIIKDPQGNRIYRSLLEIVPGQKEVNIEPQLKRVQLWDVTCPLLYRCELLLCQGNDSLKVVERFGFRHFEFQEKGPFYLNGRRLLLQGTHRHEDHAGVGAALTEDMMRKEMHQMKDMGVNFIRLGHYQQSDLILQLCDELGILVWEEIPWCRGGLGGKVYKEQARRMLVNMIEQHYNHPAVILWGLGNEIDWPGDFEGYDKQAIRQFMSELNELAHQLDPGRMTSIRRCEFCKDIIDVYSPTIWAGWYSRAFRDYREMEWAGMQAATRFLHVEWGGDSHARRHMEGDFQGVKSAANAGDWSESYIIRLFDWHLMEQSNMPWLTGTAFWTFKDFSTPLRPNNPVPYVNQKGVVERDGTLKESYFVFQSYWTEKPMVHIYGHTWPVRWGKTGEQKEVLVYSNCPEVELFVNGVSQGRKKRVVTDFPAAGLHWQVVLKEGHNTLKAIGYHKKQQITDSIHQEYQTESWGKESRIVLKQTLLPDTDTVLIEAQLVDARGVRCLDSRKGIEFQVNGEGQLIQNQGTSTGSRKVQAYNGRACIRVVAPGSCNVVAKVKELAPAFVYIKK